MSGIHRSSQAPPDDPRLHHRTPARGHRPFWRLHYDQAARPAGQAWTAQYEDRWIVPYWYIDTGFATLLILLAVVDSGLGAVFFGPPDIADFRAEFGVPPEWMPIGAIAVGYPDPAADPVKPARPGDRKSLAELVHRGR